MATATQLNKGGINPTLGLLGPTAWHTGEIGATSATMGTDTTPVVTETYVARVFLPLNQIVTGIALLNGSAVAGNVTAWFADSNGVVLGSTASTAQSGTAAFQRIALATPLTVRGPGTYFVALQFNNTGARFRTHALGNFLAGKLTGTTYGTLATFTAPSGFTADLGPVADIY